MSVTKRAIVVPDQHFPIHDKKAVSVVQQAIEIVKPNLFINLGLISGFFGKILGLKLSHFISCVFILTSSFLSAYLFYLTYPSQ